MSCYCNTLNSHTTYRLFQSCCTSFYGCELWCVLDDEIQGLCTVWRKSIRHTVIFCLCYAIVFLYLTSYASVHLTLHKDGFLMIQMLLNLFLTIVLSMVVNSCIGKNVMFCMQRYKCNVKMVFSGQINTPSRTIIISNSIFANGTWTQLVERKWDSIILFSLPMVLASSYRRCFV